MTDRVALERSDRPEESWLKKKTAFLNRNLPNLFRDRRITNWFGQKDDLLNRLADFKNTRQKSGESTYHDNEKLLVDLTDAEETNNDLHENLRDLQNELIHKRITARTHFRELDKIKSSYLQYVAEEKDLCAEIRFMEEEKAQMEKVLAKHSLLLDDNLSVLGKLIEDIEFVSGEIEMWTEKLIVIESEVPLQNRELDFIDVKISDAYKALSSLGSRLAAIEYSVKTDYYKNK